MSQPSQGNAEAHSHAGSRALNQLPTSGNPASPPHATNHTSSRIYRNSRSLTDSAKDSHGSSNMMFQHSTGNSHGSCCPATSGTPNMPTAPTSSEFLCTGSRSFACHESCGTSREMDTSKTKRILGGLYVKLAALGNLHQHNDISIDS